MKTIRNYVYAALLAASALTFSPTPACAQEMAKGKFTLTHDVRWQNAVVPAGEYRFSLDSEGAGGMLMVRGVRSGFMFMVHDTVDAKSSDLSRLVLQSTPEGSYVSAMQLPEFGVTLKFSVPSTEKQMAKATTPSLASGQ
jgi:hypothetical protein